MPFSIAKARTQALEQKIIRAKIMARTGCNIDFTLAHPAESRDAKGESPSYTLLIKRVKEDNQKFHKEREARMKKLGKRL